MMALVIAFVKTCNYELTPEREQKPRLLCLRVFGGVGEGRSALFPRSLYFPFLCVHKFLTLRDLSCSCLRDDHLMR